MIISEQSSEHIDPLSPTTRGTTDRHFAGELGLSTEAVRGVISDDRVADGEPSSSNRLPRIENRLPSASNKAAVSNISSHIKELLSELS